MTCMHRDKQIQNRKKYQNTDRICKIHRKQVAEKNSKKLIITLQYKKIFQKTNHFGHCMKIYRNFSFTRITFVKKRSCQQKLTEITKKNILTKFFQAIFRKRQEILDQFNRSTKSYIKMFGRVGLKEICTFLKRRQWHSWLLYIKNVFFVNYPW